MSAPGKSVTIWTDEPRRRGLAWAAGNAGRLARQCRLGALMRFISVVGHLGVPGMKLFGTLQAWALRRMGAQCTSNQIWIGPGVHFDFPGNLVFGRRVVIGGGSRITARETIVIGDDFLSAPGLFLNTGTHDLATLVPQSSPITIEPGVWCGTRVTVCAGVTIGRGAILGAGSLVLDDVPPGHLAFGSPCKPRRDLTPLRRDARLWSNFRAR